MGAEVVVDINLDLKKYGAVIADKVAQLVNADVKNKARGKVRVRSGRLRNSIRVDKLGAGNYITLAETPYALAQEYGRPDLPNYGFTPYMRPAAHEAGQEGNINKAVKQAEIVAEMKAKIKKTYRGKK